MSVLSKTVIKERLNLEISDLESLVITPFDEGALDADSIDLRLGCHFLFPPLPAQPAVDVQERTGSRTDFKLHVPKGGKLILPAHQTVLGVTIEFIKLPYDLSGQILTKSSVARIFVAIETAPWIHPQYRGCLTLEITNGSSSAVTLRPEMPIGQLILFTIERPEKSEKLAGTYLGPIHPESPLTQKPHSH